MSFPSFQNGCIAPSNSATSVYLAGVSTAGTLAVYSVDISNPNSPTITPLATNTYSSWSPQAKKACIAFPGLQGTANAPFLVQQFGVGSTAQVNVYPNGTTWGAFSFNGISFMSPQLYNYAGASKESVWITAATNNTYVGGGPWTGMRLNATDMFATIADPVLTNYPSVTPLVSVGTYIPTANTPAQGYTIVFDLLGGGSIYTALNTAVSLTGADRVTSLSSPRAVDMGGFKLTSNVIPVTMVGVAYLLDQALDGTTVLYTINPAQDSKLQRVAFPGSAPLFSPSMQATALGSQIVTYGSGSGSAASPFNTFDTIAATWSGPGLVVPSPITPTSTSTYPSPTSSQTGKEGDTGSKTPIGAIVGGVVGALVVIALIAFFVIRSRRKNKEVEKQSSAGPASAYHEPAKPDGDVNYNNNNNNNNIGSPNMTQLQGQHLQLQQQQQQQQQGGFDPRTSYYSQPPTSPTIFQAQPDYSNSQKPYNYSPPIFNPNAQQPTIFQPASSSPQQSQGQTLYSPAHTAVPYSPTASQTQSNPPGTPHFNGYV
ncbi:hypothetical protein EC957_009388 [Mortierella hygrophila]|uniref:Uncharacterized protein n=1 Tax=Mortierella hygrophila TaxID=979708 RepID=A0A9P6K538_9FUNG|nr:hypothetical protein EC957_009388 [Mortierella hygrophila]